MPDNSAIEFSITDDGVGDRLDSHLAALLGVSRARVQRGIEAGDVAVNGKPIRSSYRLRSGDTIEADLPETVSTDIIPEDLPLTILYEDDDLFVIDKPAGMVVHPAAGISRGTLANALAFRLGAASTRPDTALRPGLVHRLDRDTSGVMVVAKHDAALDHLSEQFRQRTVEKHYTAMVYGQPAKRRGTIDVPLGRDRKNRLKMAVYPAGQGRPALSLFTALKYFGECSLLDVEIKTGRTHQIRVHCAHIHHPVVADELYGKGRAANIRNVAIRQALDRLGRQFLHAARLGFTHPRSGERLEFVSPLPADLQAFLEICEGSGQ